MNSEQQLLLYRKSSDKTQRCSPTALVFTGLLIWDSTCTGVILLLPSALMIPFLYFSVWKTQRESFIFPLFFSFFWPECSFPLIERVHIQLRIDAMIPHQIKHDIRWRGTCDGVVVLVPLNWGLPATLAPQMSFPAEVVSTFPPCYNLPLHLKYNIMRTKLLALTPFKSYTL